MTALTPLEQALVAWTRDRSDRGRSDVRQQQIDDAISLRETGVFSIRHIILITEIPETLAYELLEKRDRKGGRFNPESLHEIHDLWLQWAQAGLVSRDAVRSIVRMGTSPTMLSRLTGISRTAIYKWCGGEAS